MKYRLLTSPWKPDNGYIFPICYVKRNLKFQRRWLDQFEWLVYTSSGAGGAICKYCALFTTGGAGRGWQTLKSLVTEPFNKWKNAIEQFKKHSQCAYHKSALLMADQFMSIYSNKSKSVVAQLDLKDSMEVELDRQRLIPIVETIIMCGRQELALRGSNDSGDVGFGCPEPEENDGNFRSLLRMRYNCGDKNLIHHVQNLAKNATYFSPDIQNELIETCGTLIQQKIVEDVKTAKYFSVLLDETTDISTKEQVSLCLRYVSKQEHIYVMKENFITYVVAEETTGGKLAELILDNIKRLGLDARNMVGQGYDGAAAMSGRFKGVQSIIREDHPQALYVHCSSHVLNLALSHSCMIPAIRNTIGTIKSIGNFLTVRPRERHY